MTAIRYTRTYHQIVEQVYIVDIPADRDDLADILADHEDWEMPEGELDLYALNHGVLVADETRAPDDDELTATVEPMPATVQHDDGTTAVALIDLARHIVDQDRADQADIAELSPAPSVVVGVIEWGSDHDDQEPAVYVGTTETAVRLAAYRDMLTAAEWADPDVDLAELPEVDESDPTTVKAWLDAWREQTTAAWFTVGTSLVLA